MILVTGGAGFIGSNLVNKLNKIGFEKIIIVDNLNSNIKKKNNIKDLNYIELYDKNYFLKLINEDKIYHKFDTVFHLGACSTTTNLDKKYMLQNNYEYSKNLLNWCQNKKIPLIYASSASVYGNKKNFHEDSSMEPLNPYAYSKMLFDEFVSQNLNNFSTPVIGLRYFNVYGPNELHKYNMSSPLFKFRDQLLNKNKISIFSEYGGYKDGEHSRDFIHVDDCINVNIFFSKNLRSGIYNVGTGKTYTFNLVAKNIIKYYGKGTIEYIDFPTILKKSYQTYTKADINKLINIGYNLPFTDLKSGLFKYMNYLDSQFSK